VPTCRPCRTRLLCRCALTSQAGLHTPPHTPSPPCPALLFPSVLPQVFGSAFFQLSSSATAALTWGLAHDSAGAPAAYPAQDLALLLPSLAPTRECGGSSSQPATNDASLLNLLGEPLPFSLPLHCPSPRGGVLCCSGSSARPQPANLLIPSCTPVPSVQNLLSTAASSWRQLATTRRCWPPRGAAGHHEALLATTRRSWPPRGAAGHHEALLATTRRCWPPPRQACRFCPSTTLPTLRLRSTPSRPWPTRCAAKSPTPLMPAPPSPSRLALSHR
jgi:hypothetical protein